MTAPDDMAMPFKSRIETGDVLNVLRNQQAQYKFDVIIADPPYNIGKDFGDTKDTMPFADYLAWSQKWINLCLQLLSDNGLMYVYGFSEILSHIATKYPQDQQRWLIWHYTNKAVPKATFWQRSHESILCLWKPDTPRPAVEVDQIREAYTDGYMKNVGRVRAGTASRFGQGKETIYKAHDKGALPRDVIKVPALAGGAGASERWFICYDCGGKIYSPSEFKNHRGHNTLRHPTQKPMELTRRLLRSRINGNGGRVLIPFAGSGSECVVAHARGIEYLGIEINKDYADMARKWIKCIS